MSYYLITCHLHKTQVSGHMKDVRGEELKALVFFTLHDTAVEGDLSILRCDPSMDLPFDQLNLKGTEDPPSRIGAYRKVKAADTGEDSEQSFEKWWQTQDWDEMKKTEHAVAATTAAENLSPF